MNRIRELRKRAGIEQKQLASIIGVARPTVSDWDLGKKNPSGERLKKLADYFGVSTGVVLGYEEIPNPVPILFIDDGTESAEQQVIDARERVRRDPERSVLFSMATNADINNVRRAIAILKALESTDENNVDTE